MTVYRRHAVYFAPPAGGPLAEFGAAWLGWDASAGRDRPHPEISDLPLPVDEITATPRPYGFHGTLKPPFRLEGEPDRLEDAIQAIAAATPAFETPRLRLSRLGGFLALVPSRQCQALTDLAFTCVRDLDGFRAAPSPQELEKRRAKGLTEEQERMLTAWGYPYVGPEFRFHLTLTGWFDEATAEAIRAALAPHAAPFTQAPMPVEEICWFGEAEDKRFHLIRRFPLTG